MNEVKLKTSVDDLLRRIESYVAKKENLSKKEAEPEKVKKARLYAIVSIKLYKKLQIHLAKKNISYVSWLEEQINNL